MSLVCDEAQENRGIYFPIKDTGHVTKNDIDSPSNFYGLFVT